jgi:hypothetical protein
MQSKQKEIQELLDFHKSLPKTSQGRSLSLVSVGIAAVRSAWQHRRNKAAASAKSTISLSSDDKVLSHALEVYRQTFKIGEEIEMGEIMDESLSGILGNLSSKALEKFYDVSGIKAKSPEERCCIAAKIQHTALSALCAKRSWTERWRNSLPLASTFMHLCTNMGFDERDLSSVFNDKAYVEVISSHILKLRDAPTLDASSSDAVRWMLTLPKSLFEKIAHVLAKQSSTEPRTQTGSLSVADIIVGLIHRSPTLCREMIEETLPALVPEESPLLKQLSREIRSKIIMSFEDSLKTLSASKLDSLPSTLMPLLAAIRSADLTRGHHITSLHQTLSDLQLKIGQQSSALVETMDQMLVSCKTAASRATDRLCAVTSPEKRFMSAMTTFHHPKMRPSTAEREGHAFRLPRSRPTERAL